MLPQHNPKNRLMFPTYREARYMTYQAIINGANSISYFGLTLGETDEFGFNATKDRVHVHDLHATILHLLGFDHTRLTVRFQGRDFRLTDVHGEVVQKLLA